MSGADDPGWVACETGGGRLAFDPAQGNLRRLVLPVDGREIEPLHTAHWVGDPVPEGMPPVEARLAGDFLCAPFGETGKDSVPPHGWPANVAWDVTPAPGRLDALLRREVRGARISKRLILSEDTPILYQEHWISGGDGPLTVAYHPMIRCAAGARASYSPKRTALTPATPLEPGRNALTYPASGPLDVFPGADRPVDLHDLPIGRGTEDFVTLVEAEGRNLGWTALLREAEDDLIVVLKDARTLLVTMLWHSNGGRDYAPWDGCHDGVLGIEDGCAAGIADPHAAAGPNPVAATGVATALTLAPGRTHRIAQAILALSRDGWTGVADLACEGAELAITSDTSATRRVPFRPDFIREAS
ncbi:MAG: hypothetical protein AAF390_08840 [Pseudomonadota bacterium]